ncbi:unnamed protein product, partial [marine sediment metagenome]
FEGGGGSGGGEIIILCSDFDNSGTISANGGDGGDAGTAGTHDHVGGGGGGGIVYGLYETLTSGGTLNALLGSAGTGEDGYAGQNGTAGTTATIRAYTKVLDADGSLTKFYDEDFTVDTDPDMIPFIDGTIGIRNDLRIEIQSDNASDTSVSVKYCYISEDME